MVGRELRLSEVVSLPREVRAGLDLYMHFQFKLHPAVVYFALETNPGISDELLVDLEHSRLRARLTVPVLVED